MGIKAVQRSTREEATILVGFWSTGYGRGFGGSEQIANALLRRFPVQTLRTILITNGNSAPSITGAVFMKFGRAPTT